MWIDDDILEQCNNHYTQAIWEPQKPVAILGSSNKPEVECDLVACAKDDVAVLRRYGGGGTVVLHPGCVVLSIGAWVNHFYQNDIYFVAINKAVIECLALRWPELKHLEQRGLSDICSKDKKIAGTSMFRSRNYLLYQASILVEPDLQIINKYLKHPSKEPEYRAGRSHNDFLLGISDLCSATTQQVVEQLKDELPRVFQHILEQDLIDPIDDQIPHLLKRANAK